ncbi:hypothetical protein LB507_001540 [Fusarium sp. FIESC RH6]|nr:hypothetical protein LB507_001540 [Fusarium sp. FIESC RH6]
MSQHDSDSESDGSITASSTSSDGNPPEGYVEGRACHFLGHLEAIPVTREGTLVQVHHAWVRVADRNDHEFSVLSSNPHGPRFNFCYKLPGPGNNWLARTSNNTDATTELFVHVQKQGIKGHKIHVYQCVHVQNSSWIIESYPKENKTKRIPQDEALAWSLQQRLHFEIGDTVGRHPWNRPSRYNQRGRESLAMDEDERMDSGEDLDEDEDEESDGEEDEDEDEEDEEDEDDDEESDDEEDEDNDEESVPPFGAIWASRA